MAVIQLGTFLTSSRFTGTLEYDDATGLVTIQVATGITTDENVIKEILLALEESASGKRTNLDSPISEPAFVTTPNYSAVLRSDGQATPTTETQTEYTPQIVLWLKAVDPTTSDAVNDND